MKQLTKEQQEIFKCMPVVEIADLLPDLYFFETCDFGGMTISELIDIVQK